MKLQGKTAIVTGATSGMGQAIAKRFVQEGAQVILSGRDEKRGKGLEDELNQGVKKAVFVSGDISIPEVNQQLVQSALKNFGKIDIISTNAGKLGLGSVTDLSFEEWNETVATTLSRKVCK